METATHRPPKLVNFDAVDSIWEYLRTKNEIQYLWLGQQSYQPIIGELSKSGQFARFDLHHELAPTYKQCYSRISWRHRGA